MTHTPRKIAFSLIAVVLAVSLLGCLSCAKKSYSPSPAPAISADEAKRLRALGYVGEADSAEGLFDSMAQGGADELWVLVRPESSQAAGDDRPRSGLLRTLDPESGEVLPVPLQHTDVRASIAGTIATVLVEQQFYNPFDRTIEAEYVFPLPDDAAVSDFVMVIGERRIRGVIREREEAEEIYREARRQGYRASLLTQERPNVFTQRVANIEAGKQIDVQLTYFNRLSFADGAYEFVFPMVVGPRYNPAGSTDGIGAVSREKLGTSGQSTEVPYLRPGERSGHDVSLTVDLDAGVALDTVKSTTHAVDVEWDGLEKATVRLTSRAAIPDRDFILRYEIAGSRVASTLFKHEDETGRYFSLELHPPGQLQQLARSPRELIFVIDTSGSMSGAPIAIAKRAVANVLERMTPDDTFQIIRFSNNTSSFGRSPVPATEQNVRKGLKYLDRLDSGGGTEMLRGIRAALRFPHAPERLRLITFLTDGFIGNEADILAEIQRGLGSSRIFSFGIGSSPNRFLMDRMAFLGRGAVAYIGENQELADEVVDSFFERIAHPALAEIEIDWQGMEIEEIYPARVPDLFPGRPVILTGRYEGALPSAIRLFGRAEGREIVVDVPIEGEATAEHPALRNLWARRKISELAMQSLLDSDVDTISGAIKEVALDHGLMSAYTAFVAVDASGTVGEPSSVTVPVPVSVPHGVRHDSTLE